MRQESVDPVVIVSLGRSGSTLLMRVLNAVKGVYIFGEHGGAFRHLRCVYQDISHNQDQQIANGAVILSKEGLEDRFIAWASPFNADEVLEYLRGLSSLYTSKLPPDMLIWGFKEIIYNVDDLLFFTRLWPKSKFIFLRRNIEDSLRSAYVSFYGRTRDVSYAARDHLTRYEAQERSLQRLAEQNPEQVLKLDYEEMCTAPDMSYARVFSFLDLTTEIPWESIKRIADIRVDYIPPEAKHDPEKEMAVEALRSIIREVSSPA